MGESAPGHPTELALPSLPGLALTLGSHRSLAGTGPTTQSPVPTCGRKGRQMGSGRRAADTGLMSGLQSTHPRCSLSDRMRTLQVGMKSWAGGCCPGCAKCAGLWQRALGIADVRAKLRKTGQGRACRLCRSVTWLVCESIS